MSEHGIGKPESPSESQPESQTGMRPRHVHRLMIRRRTRVVMSIALGLIAGVTLACLYVYAQAMRTPEWMQRAERESRALGSERATAFENAVLNECTHVRPVDPTRSDAEPWRSEPWAMAIDPADVNNWIEESGLRWAAHQKKKDAEAATWPRGLRTLRIGISDDGGLRLAATVHDRAGNERTVGVITTIRMAADGLWLEPSRVEIGELSVNASWVVQRAQRAMRQVVPEEMQALPQVQAVLSAARGETPLVSRPVIRLPDGRRVRILAIEPEGKRLIVTCRTEGRMEGKAEAK